MFGGMNWFQFSSNFGQAFFGDFSGTAFQIALWIATAVASVVAFFIPFLVGFVLVSNYWPKLLQLLVVNQVRSGISERISRWRQR